MHVPHLEMPQHCVYVELEGNYYEFFIQVSACMRVSSTEREECKYFDVR